jgi:hypothetical protein
VAWAEPSAAVAVTVPCVLPSASFSVKGSDEEAPAGIETDVLLSPSPPAWDSETVTAPPDELATWFWNRSTSVTWADMKRDVPRGARGLSVQAGAAPEVQVTAVLLVKRLVPAVTPVKASPAAVPALIVSGYWIGQDRPARSHNGYGPASLV